MNAKQRNELIKEHIVLPENCHCTIRAIVKGSETAALAKCNESGKIRARIRWFHTDQGETKLTYKLPFGVSIHEVIPSVADEDLINQKITSGFEKMHGHWNTNL